MATEIIYSNIWQLNDGVCERVKYHVSEVAIERERKTGESSQCFSMPM